MLRVESIHDTRNVLINGLYSHVTKTTVEELFHFESLRSANFFDIFIYHDGFKSRQISDSGV